MNTQNILLVLAIGLLANGHCRTIDVSCEQDLYDSTFPVHIRHARQIYGSASGSRATIGANGNLFNQNGHRLSGHGQITQDFKPKGPTEFGAGLNYQGPRVEAKVDANHVRGFGTDVSAQGKVNVWKSDNGKSQFYGAADYNQHLGGPGGRSPPNYNVGVGFIRRF